MVNWTRNRVVNFTRDFAEPYVELLVGLDGQPYDQSLFFKFLADAGIVNDVRQDGEETEIAERRWKRWDSYLGKIREYGIGFAVDEIRKGAKNTRRSIWKASNIAKDFAAGRLSYRQFMALQCMRQQLPRPSMPLQPAPRLEIQRGVLIRPLGLILQALAELENRGEAVYLSRNEIFSSLTTVEQHDRLGSVIDLIAAARGKPESVDVTTAAQSPGEISTEPEAEELETGQPSQDIWLNEFAATDYIRQLRPTQSSGLPQHIIVRGLPRWEEANLLNQLVPMQEYDITEETINAYYDFLSASPSSQELEILRMDARVVQLEVPTEAQFNRDEKTLTGRIEIVGGLSEGALVHLVGDDLDPRTKATIFEVTQAESRPSSEITTVHLSPYLVRADNQPVSSS